MRKKKENTLKIGDYIRCTCSDRLIMGNICPVGRIASVHRLIYRLDTGGIIPVKYAKLLTSLEIELI